MEEYAGQSLKSGISKEIVNLGSQMQLKSLETAVDKAISGGVVYGKLYTVNGWELVFSAPRGPRQFPALIHALPKY